MWHFLWNMPGETREKAEISKFNNILLPFTFSILPRGVYFHMHAYEPAVLFPGLHPIQGRAHVRKEIGILMFKPCVFSSPKLKKTLMSTSSKHSQWTTRQQWEWTNHSYMWQHGRTLETWCWVKEARCSKNVIMNPFI